MLFRSHGETVSESGIFPRRARLRVSMRPRSLAGPAWRPPGPERSLAPHPLGSQPPRRVRLRGATRTGLVPRAEPSGRGGCRWRGLAGLANGQPRQAPSRPARAITRVDPFSTKASQSKTERPFQVASQSICSGPSACCLRVRSCVADQEGRWPDGLPPPSTARCQPLLAKAFSQGRRQIGRAHV